MEPSHVLLEHKQSSFVGGMNQQLEPTKIGDNQYPLLVNGRVREDIVEPIRKNLEFTVGKPSGKLQGIYSIGLYLVLVANGRFYYKDTSDSGSPFLLIKDIAGGNLTLSTQAEYIYLELIPSSTINFGRKLVSGTDVKSGVELSGSVTASPDCAIATDGINQPVVIFPTALGRKTKTYEEWSLADREYVPKGLFPMFNSDGILYLAGRDSEGRLNQILRSVTGRPLDSMVAIDTNGDKLTNQIEGNASAVSYRVDFNDITSIARINSPEGFLVSTSNNSYLVIPDYQNTIFGEPTFSRQFLFSTGALNPFSVIDILGDTIIIDRNGLVSFNAVLYSRNEGRNLPFSKSVSKLLAGITQDVTCATKLDNYVYFAVTTVYGPAVLVFDEITGVFVSVDLPSNLTGKIKQFTAINTNSAKEVWFITTDNKLYKLGGSTEVETCKLYLGEWAIEKTNAEQKTFKVDLALSEVYQEGDLVVKLFVDGREDQVATQFVDKQLDPPSGYLTPPLFAPSEDKVLPLSLAFPDSTLGWKIGVFLEWSFQAKLNYVSLSTQVLEDQTSAEQQGLMHS